MMKSSTPQLLTVLLICFISLPIITAIAKPVDSDSPGIANEIQNKWKRTTSDLETMKRNMCKYCTGTCRESAVYSDLCATYNL